MSAEIPNNGPRVTLTLDEPLYRRLAGDAKASDRSLAGEVRHRLRKALEQTPAEQTAS
jgi:hypothetical protein